MSIWTRIARLFRKPEQKTMPERFSLDPQTAALMKNDPDAMTRHGDGLRTMTREQQERYRGIYFSLRRASDISAADMFDVV